MKFTTKHIPVLLVLFILCFVNLSSPKAQIFDVDSLKFTILLDKEKYLLNEPIWVTVKLENVSLKRVFPGSLDPLKNFLHFYVVSSKGDTLPGGCIMGNFAGSKYPTLDPGETDVLLINLIGPICTYGIEDETALFFRRIPEGKYIIQVKLRDFYHTSLDERTDVLSNQLSFKVEKSSGKERKVYDLLLKGYKAFRNKKYKPAADCFLRILNQHPKSVYVSGIYPHLTYLYRLELKNDYKGENSGSIAERYLENYPNSGIVASCIDALRPGPGRTADRKKFYEEIIKKYPNTKASMYAENQLDKWRRGKIWVDEPIPKD